MKQTINTILILVLAAFMMQCEVVSDDLLTNPNAPNPDNASPDFLLNNIQLQTESFFNIIEHEGAELTRMEHMFAGTYPSAYQPQFFDAEWTDAYAGALVDVQTLKPLAKERELYTHEGIARILEAFIYINLVDRWDAVPLEEALDESDFNPALNTGQEVYAHVFAQLDSARTALNKSALAAPGDDLYYGNTSNPKQNWIKLANTLELKALYQQRNIGSPVTPEGAGYESRINELINPANDLVIDEPEESFTFQYGTNTNNPDTRHPGFTDNYLTGANDYMANYYMNLLWQDKETASQNDTLDHLYDPRIRYYFYRQENEPTDNSNEMDCIGNSFPPSHYQGNGNGEGINDPWCQEWNQAGYWGRDHGNDDGIPPDNTKRTTFGPYPTGGAFDANQATGVGPGMGMQGAGIQPMWMSFFTDFVRAEVELTINGDQGAARAALEDGIRNSIDEVMAFGEPAVQAADTTMGQVPDQSHIDSYVNAVLDRWDNQAVNDREREFIIGKEFYLALFGNGVEAYNLYRRVAPPKENPFWNLQPNLSSSPGQFYNTLSYPANFVERNSAAQQRDVSQGPFWFTADSEFANF